MDTNKHEFMRQFFGTAVGKNSQDNSLPLWFGPLKIQDHSDTRICDPQIIQHQSLFVVSDPVKHLCIHDDRIKSDQIGNEQANLPALVEHIEGRLLAKRNLPQTKLNDQRIFVWLLDEPVAERV